ncbi:MAG: NAD(P)+ transhydrogenase beta chain [Rhabdaerophilum sp.]
MAELEKPSYSTTKTAMWISGFCAWALVFIVVVGGVGGSTGALALAPTVIPAMVALIVALLGVHRAFGSIDMRTIAGQNRAPRKRREPPEPREEPA